MTKYEQAHIERISAIAVQYVKRKAKFSLYARVFKLSKDEKAAYKIYKIVKQS